MNCTNCNNEISENSMFCNVCGAPVNGQENANNAYSGPQNNQNYNQQYNQGYNQQYNQGYNQQYNQGYNQQYNQGYNQQYNQYQQPFGYNNSMPNPGDVPSAGLNILAFLFPMIGLILYLIWKDQYPTKAKAVGKWGLIGFVVSFVLGFVIGMVGSMVTVFSYMAI